jgi:hypothetical protein
MDEVKFILTCVYHTHMTGTFTRRLIFFTTKQWRSLVNTGMKFWIPLNPRKFFNSSATGCPSRKAKFQGVR